MEWLESMVRFLGSYPTWAKACLLAALVVSMGVLILAPRTGPSAAEMSSSAVAAPNSAANRPANAPIFLKIGDVRLFPDDASAEVRILAFVNGTKYVHPSVGGVTWMKIGPDMSHKVIQLPQADTYEVRFEMQLRGGAEDASAYSAKEVRVLDPHRSMVAQNSAYIRALPFKDTYKLYRVIDKTRYAGVAATVSYELYKGD